MRISDWSSDVCSSDLGAGLPLTQIGRQPAPSRTRFKPVVAHQSLNAMQAAARSVSGLGIVQLPGYMAEPHVVEGSLVRALTSWERSPVPVHAVFASTRRSEEHTSELQSLMRTSYAVF